MKQNPRSIGQARQLRKDSTPAEVILWKHLRGRRFEDYKFRRQKPIGGYIVDFVCVGMKLIIELDGESHLNKQLRDKKRDVFLQEHSYRVLRYWNNQIYDELESVLEEIWLVLYGKK